MSELRVLHVIDQLTGGGAEVSLVEYLSHVAANSDVTHSLVVLNGRPESRAVAEGLPIEVTMGDPGRRPRWSDADLVREAIGRSRPDVVHCALVRSTLATARSLRGSDIPMLVTLTSVHYDVEDEGGSFKQRWGIRLSHTLHGIALRRDRVYFHAVSEPVADKAIEVFGLDPDRIMVVPRGRPDPKRRLTSDRSGMRRLLDIPDGAPTLVTVAREHLVKNHLTLIQSATTLQGEFADLTLLFVGGRSTASEAIDEALRDSPLASRVRRLGHREDVPDLLAAADVFVSTSASEGLPGSIVEALGMGLPVVAFDVTGVRDVLGAGYPGLIPYGDVDRLTAQIRETLTDPGLGEELSRVGRERFEESFEIDGYASRMQRIYRQVTARADEHDDLERAAGGELDVDRPTRQ